MLAGVDLARRHGAVLHFDEPVTGWRVTPGGGVEVDTATGRYGADRLVLTPGAWAPQLLPTVAPILVERQVFYWFEPDFTAGVPYESYADGHPVYIEETDGNGLLYGFPMIDGPDGGLKLAFYRQNIGTTTPETIDRTVHADEVDAIRRRAVQLFPHLTGPLVKAATCMYASAPDDHFVIGLLDGMPQVVVACGFSGHGFKFVPVVGEIVADLVQTGTTAHDIDLFDIERPAVWRSLTRTRPITSGGDRPTVSTTTLDLASFKALSFDCYGTLIDWEAGISAVLVPWASEQSLDLSVDDLLLAYGDSEAAVEREAPTALYPDVLAEAFRRTGAALGEPVSDDWAARLGGSVPDWPAFPDSAEALARLARHCQLIIVSNVHRAGFAGSNQHLRGDFAAVITAEDVGAYKPAENHFRALDRILPEIGVGAPAAARRAEPVPRPRARETGRPAVGVDQPSSRPSRLGRHPGAVPGLVLRPRVRFHGRFRRRCRRRVRLGS